MIITCLVKVVSELSSNIGTVEGLERFQYKDKNGKDWGLNVRQRAKELRSLVTNPELIRRERQKVQAFASSPEKLPYNSGLNICSHQSACVTSASAFLLSRSRALNNDEQSIEATQQAIFDDSKTLMKCNCFRPRRIPPSTPASAQKRAGWAASAAQIQGLAALLPRWGVALLSAG